MDRTIRRSGSNPLTRAVTMAPARTGRLLSYGGRAAGAALAFAVAVDQSYTRTRTLALALAVLALLTLFPPRVRLAGRLAWLGAGLVFFGGALLAHLPPGKAMLAAGVLAALGAAVDDQNTGRTTGAPWFFMAVGVLIALIAVIVLSIEG